jgi:hypothetical protein
MCWQMEELLLVGVVWEVTMLRKKLRNKPIHVEMSLGNVGNMACDKQHDTKQPIADNTSGMFIVFI